MALNSARKLLQLTPWNEAMHRQVMLLLVRTGQREAALKQYQLCQTTLEAELGVNVSAETTALYERIKRNAPFRLWPFAFQPRAIWRNSYKTIYLTSACCLFWIILSIFWMEHRP